MKHSVWNFAKGTLVCFAVGLSMFAFTSCGNGELSERRAKSELEELPYFQKNGQFVELKTGFYELDDADARFVLKKLAATGVINYKVENIENQERIKTGYSYYYGASYKTVNVNHYFVTVSLTPEGEKFNIKEPVTAKEDADMKFDDKKVAYPEDEVTPDVEKEVGQTQVTPEAEKDTTSPEVEAEQTEPVEILSSTQSAYEIAKGKESIVVCNMLADVKEIVKIRNIYCPEEWLKIGKATCEVIYENADVTPFGRIIAGIVEGERHKDSASFVYYEDKGWQLSIESK